MVTLGQQPLERDRRCPSEEGPEQARRVREHRDGRDRSASGPVDELEQARGVGLHLGRRRDGDAVLGRAARGHGRTVSGLPRTVRHRVERGAWNSICTSSGSTGPAARPGSAPASPTSPSAPRRSACAPSRSWTTSSRWSWMAPAEDPMLEGYTALGFVAGRTTAAAAAAPGHRRDLSPPRAAGEDRDDPRRRVERPRRARASARPGTTVSTAGWACRSLRPPSGSSAWRKRSRSACRCGATTTARTEGVHYQLDETLCSPMPVSTPRPRILIGGWRRAEDAPARRAVRRRVQHLRRSRRGRAQGRRAAPPLRRARTRPERDRGHRDVPRLRSGRDAPTTSCAAPRRSRRSACRPS